MVLASSRTGFAPLGLTQTSFVLSSDVREIPTVALNKMPNPRSTSPASTMGWIKGRSVSLSTISTLGHDSPNALIKPGITLALSNGVAATVSLLAPDSASFASSSVAPSSSASTRSATGSSLAPPSVSHTERVVR